MGKNRSNFNLNHLPVFVAIAESKSLTEAAQAVRQDKTRVSRILSELEGSLNVELVYRTTRDLRLTDAGQLFYVRCKEIMTNVEDATDQLSRKETEVSGHVCLTAAHGIASVILPLALREFGKLHPQVTFEIRMTQQSLNLAKEGIDIALRVGMLPDSSYLARKIGLIRYAFVATPKFLNSYPPVRKIEDTQSAKTVTFSHFNKKALHFKKANETLRIRLDSGITSNSPDFILSVVLQDMAMGLLPEFVCRDHVATGRLVPLFDRWQLEPVPISLLFHKSALRPAAVTAFIEFLANYFVNVLN
jgi:LysR family transcriptional regulator, regulator for bpeEF and oprC